MAQYPHSQPYFDVARPQLGLGGNLTHLHPGGPHQSLQTTSDMPKTTVFLCLPKRKTCGKYEELMALCLHPQPYSGPAQPQLGVISRTCHQGEPH